MIRVPPQVAALITGLWAIGVAYTSQLPHLPGWVAYAIAGGGVVLAAFGINVPQAKGIVHSTPPPAPASEPAEGGWE